MRQVTRRYGSARCLLRRGFSSSAEDLVLLLPGAAGRAEHWGLQLEGDFWPEGCWLAAVDYPGSGDLESVLAEEGPSCTTDEAARRLWSLLVSLELAEGCRIHLVGLSFGGMVAQKMAAQRPWAVASLVLLNTYPGLSRGARPWPFFLRGLAWLTLCALTLCRWSKATSDLNEAWLLWGAPAWRMPERAWRRAILLLGAASSPSAREPTKGYWGLAGAAEAAREWLQRRLGDLAFVVAILRHSLSDAEVDVLRRVPRRWVAVGARDWLVRPSNGKRLSELLRCPLVDFQAGGHFLQLEAAEELGARLVEWCSLVQ